MGMSTLAMGSVGLSWEDVKQAGPSTPSQSFIDTDVLLVVTSVEAYEELSAQDLEFGLNETRRDRLLRTLVRNVFRWHLNEIFSALRNEYTDWERAAGLAHNPLGVRDAALAVLGDGLTVAPISRVASLHSSGQGNGNTYFAHMLPGDSIPIRDFPQRPGSVRGEDLVYWLAQPLLPPGWPSLLTDKANYTQQDAQMSKACVHYLGNFIRSGDPNSRSESSGEEERKRPSGSQHSHQGPFPFWDKYDSVNQYYLDLGAHPHIKNHYRGHKLSLWLHLIPQLHRPGVGDASSRHHNFPEEGPQFYDGIVRTQSAFYPSRLPPLPAAPSPSSPASATPAMTTTECPPSPPPLAPLSPPNSTYVTNPSQQQTPTGGNSNSNNNNNNGGGGGGNNFMNGPNSMSTALIVTVTVGCSLLLLNLLIFAGIYRHHHRRSSRHRRSHEGGGKGRRHRHAAAASSPVASCSKDSPPPLVIPAPPPPPKNLPPPDITPYLPPGALGHLGPAAGGGILRNNPANSGPSSTPSTPGTAKKRVHILEISV